MQARTAVITSSFAVLALLLGVYFWLHLKELERGQLYDFATFQGSLKLYDAGRSPYTPQNRRAYRMRPDRTDFKIVELPVEVEARTYAPLWFKLNLNPPIFVMLTLPLGALTYYDAHLVYSVLSLLAFLTALLLLVQTLPRAGPLMFSAVAACSLLYLPNYLNFIYGQVAFFAFLLLVVAYRLGRVGRDKEMAALLGAAAAFKLFFGLFLVYFFFKERWRPVGWFLVAFALTMLIPLTVFDIADYSVWADAPTTLPKWLDTRMASPWNGSLMAMFYRMPFVDLETARYAGYAVAAIPAVVYVVSLYRHREDRSVERFETEFAVTALLVLLLSPLGWKYYGIFGIFAVVRILGRLPRVERPQLIVVLLGASVLATGWPVEIFFNTQAPGYPTFGQMVSLQLTLLGFLGLLCLTVATSGSQGLNSAEDPAAEHVASGRDEWGPLRRNTAAIMGMALIVPVLIFAGWL